MNLIDEAESLILHQFSRSSKLTALVRCLVHPFQEALDELSKLHQVHFIDQAFGQTLDVMGAIVDQPRLGMSDEDFRVWIKIAMIRISNGGAYPGILAIMQVLFKKTPQVTITEYAPNTVHFTLFELPAIPMKIFANIIRSSMPVGTDTQFIMAHPEPPNESIAASISSISTTTKFQFDITPFSSAVFGDFYEGDLSL